MAVTPEYRMQSYGITSIRIFENQKISSRSNVFRRSRRTQMDNQLVKESTMRTKFLAVIVLSVFALTAIAQSTTGRLTGTITDPSGTIPGATIVVKDNKTQKERTVVTGDNGDFNVPQLDPGNYTVTITAPGHKTFVANDLKIDVGRDYTLNPTLEVGAITENVSVTAGADVVNSSNAELSN